MTIQPLTPLRHKSSKITPFSSELKATSPIRAINTMRYSYILISDVKVLCYLADRLYRLKLKLDAMDIPKNPSPHQIIESRLLTREVELFCSRANQVYQIMNKAENYSIEEVEKAYSAIGLSKKKIWKVTRF